MNSDLGHASDCIFYDSELKSLKAHFKECATILKNIDKRAERRQTVQISKSLFDYAERGKDLKVQPQKYYDFVMDNYRICVFKYKGKYSILCVGFDYEMDYLRDCDFYGAGRLFFETDLLESAVVYFRRVVSYFVNRWVVIRDMEFDTYDVQF